MKIESVPPEIQDMQPHIQQKKNWKINTGVNARNEKTNKYS